MATIWQYILRTIFYVMSAYAAYLGIKIAVRKHRKKEIDNCAIYVIISVILLILLGNIIIFNIDMYDALLGTLEEHTIIYAALLVLAGTALFFLKKAIDDGKP